MMNTKHAATDGYKPQTSGQRPHSGEPSNTSVACTLDFELIFDLEMDLASTNTVSEQSWQSGSSPLQSLPLTQPSSTSEFGFVMVAHPSHSTNQKHSPAVKHTLDSPTSREMTGDERKGRMPHSPTRASPLHSRSSMGSSQREIPVSTTPRTQKFRKDMLSVLSLLPAGRYLSPTSSVSTDLNEELGGGEYASSESSSPGLYATSIGSSISVSSSCSLPRFFSYQEEGYANNNHVTPRIM
ncbi:hypothetical protein F5Y19DRAFT_427978 [Xylariaceae sp. FL1651]|nr:hypothetical protein F5Y19DRAFT_427978 [Xylariaceae sp. FL1651]